MQFRQLDEFQRKAIVTSVATGLTFKEAFKLVRDFLQGQEVTRGTVREAKDSFFMIDGLRELETLGKAQKDSISGSVMQDKMGIDEALRLAIEMAIDQREMEEARKSQGRGVGIKDGTGDPLRDLHLMLNKIDPMVRPARFWPAVRFPQRRDASAAWWACASAPPSCRAG